MMSTQKVRAVYRRTKSILEVTLRKCIIFLICSLVGPPDVTPPMTAGYLEVVDLNFKKVKYIPIPR